MIIRRVFNWLADFGLRLSFLTYLILGTALFTGCGFWGMAEIPPVGKSGNETGVGELTYRELQEDTKAPTRRITPTPTTQRTVHAENTKLPVPILTDIPTLRPSATFSPEVRTPVPNETKPNEVELCSPLEFVSLEDLPFVVSDGYHPPPMGKDDRHQGVDFSYYHWRGDKPIDGTSVQAILGGIVVASIEDSFPFGNLVIIETPSEMLSVEMRSAFEINDDESLFILYAHLNDQSPLVKYEQSVKACEGLGYVGHTGNGDASHLHLETRVGPKGSRFPVFSAFRDTDSKEEKQNYRVWRTSGLFIHFDPMRLLTWEKNRGATATPTPGKRVD